MLPPIPDALELTQVVEIKLDLVISLLKTSSTLEDGLLIQHIRAATISTYRVFCRSHAKARLELIDSSGIVINHWDSQVNPAQHQDHDVDPPGAV